MNPPVFYGAAILILLFAAVVIGFPQRAGEWLLAAQTWASQTVGWYYLLAMTLYLIFVVVTALSGYGKIKLGADHDEPEFSYLSWAGMLFAAGISITLFFFCVSEPLTHFLQPPQGEAGTQEAARQAMELLFLHWGLHGWGVFALVAMALAYFAYRHNLPLALRSALYPLIGKRINGPIGYTVDCFGIIATVFGLGADMGFGVLQLNSGLDYLYAIPHTHPVQMALIVLMMGAAISVAVSGVDKGIRILSDINMLLACSLLLFVLFAGPTQHLLNTLVQNVGDYLGHLPGKSFDLYAYGGPSDWLGSWTVFYWAWWIAWAPFVGLFIARISRGRTIREFVFGVLFIPLGFTLAWMSIFGNSALEQALGGASELGRVAIEQPSMALYQMLQNYPWSRAVITVTVLVSFVFFVTSADSGTVVLSTLSAHGGSADDDGPKWLRVFWGSVTALVTGGLLFAGSIDALKSAVVLTSLPFSLILLLMMWGLHKAFYMESQRQRARSHSLAPLMSGNGKRSGGWKRRLSQAVHFPSRDEVYRFMNDVVRPAISEVSEVFREKGLAVDAHPGNASLSLEIGHGEQHRFLYQVLMRGYFTPSFARAGMGGLHLKNRRYFRAEVHLAEGSQDYDLMGYTKEQIINDMLDQYERHLQFLHLVR
ncbi:choline BCCT transporter BetT [Pseudomonas aeruginosa]